MKLLDKMQATNNSEQNSNSQEQRTQSVQKTFKRFKTLDEFYKALAPLETAASQEKTESKALDNIKQLIETLRKAEAAYLQS